MYKDAKKLGQDHENNTVPSESKSSTDQKWKRTKSRKECAFIQITRLVLINPEKREKNLLEITNEVTTS